MARTKQTPVETAKVETLKTETSTMEEEVKTSSSSSEMTFIACSLPFDLEFTDVPDGKGGTKSIVFPGVNSHLRGKKSGTLALAGNALGVSVAKKDWEAILALHGREIVFTGRDGGAPCLYEVGSKEGFRAAQHDVIKDMEHGLEPVDPAKNAPITEAK